MPYAEGILTFRAGEDLEAYRRVKIDTSGSQSPIDVIYADAGEAAIGVTRYAADDTELVAIKLLNYPGSVEVEAAGALTVGQTAYGAADGKIASTSSGSALGVVKKAVAGSGEIAELVPYPFVSTTAATTSVADTGEFTEAATVEAALAEIYQHLLSAQVTIPVPLGAITMEDGTVLTKQATTVTGIAQLADKEQVISIPVDCTSGEALGFSVPVPQDLDDSADITVHVLAGKAANLDVLTLDCEVFPCGVGDTANADIQDTAAQTITEAASELVFTCGADGVLAAPGTLSVVLALGGTNDGDAVYIYGAWIEYTRKALAA